MGTVILVILGIILGFVIVTTLFAKDGEKGDAAKNGAVIGGGFVLSLLPAVITIVIAVLILRSCTWN